MPTKFEHEFYIRKQERRSFVCAAPVYNGETLHRRIVDACQTIRNYSDIL
jgi:hypothetical protein